ncbi:unnamed protein product [Caenorhabditis bovis]|uniref:Inositol-pentakisphosphate 2-kinase n=1 Tax=Caenorhabditis bovis TaxID=2654633 RepID=A0A8S1FEA2_9PELO|nr:unnamed protein product [Caenorhabditis bovis]
MMRISTNGNVLVNPREYRSFCFRGEGRANFVISAKHKKTGVRIVWRFAKARKSGLMTVKARSELVNDYMERIVAPLIDEQYLVNMQIVEFDINDVHQLAKIPSLPANEKIESFDELYGIQGELSFLPISSFRKNTPNGVILNPKRLTSLQMLDATQLPNAAWLDACTTSTITVEIKPKQGFFQQHPNVDVPNCNNCIMQIEKCGSAHFREMYDFCPLDLYSGNYSRTRKAIRSLFLVPHRNLRVFLDGNLVHSDVKPLTWKQIDGVLFPNRLSSSEDLISVLAFALSGSTSRQGFSLKEPSVLGQLLNAQMIDPLGIVRAHAAYEELSSEYKASLLDKTSISRIGIDAILDDSIPPPRGMLDDDCEKVKMLRRYFVAATMKDCSIMVSMRLVPPMCPTQPPATNIIRLPNGRVFAYSIKIVDLDPKTPKNLLNSHGRFLAGAKLIKLEREHARAQPDKHNFGFKPCVKL